MHLYFGAYDGSRAAGVKKKFAVTRCVKKRTFVNYGHISIVIPAYEQVLK